MYQIPDRPAADHWLSTSVNRMFKSAFHSTPRLHGVQQYMSNDLLTKSFLLLVIVYLILVRILRFRAVRKIEEKYACYVRDPYLMDYKTAHEIMKLSMLCDMPFGFGFGTQWALLKTFAVSSGTPLLVKTRQLTTETKIAKRAADTGAILSEFLIGSVDSDRGLKALSKLNWIHRRYGNRITNDEMIHTLAMFVLEPQRWIDRYEWRPMTNLEKNASYIYWKEIGNRMGIKDIPATLKDCEKWTCEFEKSNIYYCESNRICAECTIDMLLKNVPKFMHSFVRGVSASFLEEHVRIALGMSSPPPWIANLVWLFFSARGWAIQNLFLPRWRPLDMRAEQSSDGRFHSKSIGPEPWYIKDTMWNRWKTWWATQGRLVPGPQFKSNGYLPEELGPAEFEKLSRNSVLNEAELMKEYAEKGGAAAVGCPFSVSLNY